VSGETTAEDFMSPQEDFREIEKLFKEIKDCWDDTEECLICSLAKHNIQQIAERNKFEGVCGEGWWDSGFALGHICNKSRLCPDCQARKKEVLIDGL